MRLSFLIKELFQTYLQKGKGVVAEGILQDKNFFVAKSILAKHDENYMPPKKPINLGKNVK